MLDDVRTLGLLGGVLLLLTAAGGAVRFLKSRTDSGLDTAVLHTLSKRIQAWFLLFLVLAAAFLIGREVTIAMFWLLAFWALREFITLTPTRPGDHRTLFWVFFLITPLQFILVWRNLYEVYSILIPVFSFLLLPARIAMAGDYKRFLERTAKIEAGLLICVYCLSFAPALLMLQFPGEDAYAGPRLLLFFVLIAQLGDALQYAWAQLPSKHVIVPTINPNKTWEGLIGG
ncbi:MAG: phosphatidate cytidylyltransferase, partial [Patescibacteria group bacterium]|nr:phosphatidate cytidylyltransferase [Patescibacteria group bacterium]